MHIRESRQKLVAAAFIRVADEDDVPDVSIAFRPSCECNACMENYLRIFLVMCVQMATVNELDFESVLQEARDSIGAPTYVQ